MGPGLLGKATLAAVVAVILLSIWEDCCGGGLSVVGEAMRRSIRLAATLMGCKGGFGRLRSWFAECMWCMAAWAAIWEAGICEACGREGSKKPCEC